ncbi:hypothetical protein ONZ45_g14656 [Pleurotus djamor]|nr:hypothetical protein ONZ45_g14656 [Pleurotus djamor]
MPFHFSDAGSAVFLQVTIQNYVEVISLAILFYDYLLTFDLEVERFWRRPKLSLVPILFFVNRYGVLLGYVPTVVMLLRPEFLLPGNSALYHKLRKYTDALGPPALKALLTDIINILASTLISRLMLNLRDKSVTKLHGDTLTTRPIDAPIQFAPRMPNRNANATGFSAFSWKSDISSTILDA